VKTGLENANKRPCTVPAQSPRQFRAHVEEPEEQFVGDVNEWQRERASRRALKTQPDAA